jgi:Aspartyl protease
MRITFGDLTLPYLPLQLINQEQCIEVSGMVDTGSMVNVLPYNLGEQLGLQWQNCSSALELAGNLRGVEARGVLLKAAIGDFPIVNLAFAWAKTSNIPVILGHLNFFREFEVCFYGAEPYFELQPKR